MINSRWLFRLMIKYSWIWLMISGIAAIIGISGCSPAVKQLPPSETGTDFEIPAGFLRADGSQALEFPGDFGPHPDFQTEWWYYTGNLQGENGDRFGYQLTFFRRALQPAEDRIERKSSWATDQIYMAHFALSDIEAEEHYSFERFSRGAAGLAGARADPYQVWLENLQVSQTGKGKYQLTAAQDGIKLDLTLEDLKGPVLHGERGYSQKGTHPGNASYYYSLTRLQTSGFVQTDNRRFSVKGLSWKDHEYSTSALSPGQVGWDWFSIQLDEGSELMVFQIRRRDGSIDPYSGGTWINQQGETAQLSKDQFALTVNDWWRSPNSGADYPSNWRLDVPSLNLKLNIFPVLPDQEMEVSYTYWEGAVDITGSKNGDPVSGIGYVELTGYVESIEGQF